MSSRISSQHYIEYLGIIRIFECMNTLNRIQRIFFFNNFVIVSRVVICIWQYKHALRVHGAKFKNIISKFSFCWGVIKITSDE